MAVLSDDDYVRVAILAVAEEIGGKIVGFSAVTGEEGQRVAAAWEKCRARRYDPEVMYRA